MCVCAPYECPVHTEVRREPLELELWSCESLCRYLGPLQEYMFLMAEPLSLLTLYLKREKKITFKIFSHDHDTAMI